MLAFGQASEVLSADRTLKSPRLRQPALPFAVSLLIPTREFAFSDANSRAWYVQAWPPEREPTLDTMWQMRPPEQQLPQLQAAL